MVGVVVLAVASEALLRALSRCEHAPKFKPPRTSDTVSGARKQRKTKNRQAVPSCAEWGLVRLRCDSSNILRFGSHCGMACEQL